MSQEELQQKQEECVKLSLEIARLNKILSFKQKLFNDLDTEIYKALQQNEKDSKKNNKS